jgi:hypothetical protein
LQSVADQSYLAMNPGQVSSPRSLF